MRTRRTKPAAIGVKASYPGFIEPTLATSVDQVPWGERWLHEIKFDGYRVQVHLRDAVVKVFTRRGNDWTNRFRKIAAAHGTSTPDLRSSTVRWSCRLPTAAPISRFCRTNSRADPNTSCWSRSICCTLTATTQTQQRTCRLGSSR